MGPTVMGDSFLKITILIQDLMDIRFLSKSCRQGYSQPGLN